MRVELWRLPPGWPRRPYVVRLDVKWLGGAIWRGTPLEAVRLALRLIRQAARAAWRNARA